MPVFQDLASFVLMRAKVTTTAMTEPITLALAHTHGVNFFVLCMWLVIMYSSTYYRRVLAEITFVSIRNFHPSSQSYLCVEHKEAYLLSAEH